MSFNSILIVFDVSASLVIVGFICCIITDRVILNRVN